jgi:hypothetical protein
VKKEDEKRVYWRSTKHATRSEMIAHTSNCTNHPFTFFFFPLFPFHIFKHQNYPSNPTHTFSLSLYNIFHFLNSFSFFPLIFKLPLSQQKQKEKIRICLFSFTYISLSLSHFLCVSFIFLSLLFFNISSLSLLHFSISPLSLNISF